MTDDKLHDAAGGGKLWRTKDGIDAECRPGKDLDGPARHDQIVVDSLGQAEVFLARISKVRELLVGVELAGWVKVHFFLRAFVRFVE